MTGDDVILDDIHRLLKEAEDELRLFVDWHGKNPYFSKLEDAAELVRIADNFTKGYQ